MIPEYDVGWYVTPFPLRSGYLTYSRGRRVVSKALPLRQTQLEALLDLQGWLELRFARGDNYWQIGKQITRVGGQIAALEREAKR